MRLKTILLVLMSVGMCVDASAQADRHDVRAGNRKFRKDKFREAEIDYRKAVLKDSLSVAGQYNLASDLYRQEDCQGAAKALKTIREAAVSSDHASDYWYNLGDVALASKDYASAVDAFRQALLLTPDDLDAKENYIYARLMLQNQQNSGGGQNQNQNQNQDQNQDQNENQDRNQDQNQNQDQNENQEQNQEQKISPQQAQQMLKAIQAREKETQEKVNKEKAELLQSRQKDKNW